MKIIGQVLYEKLVVDKRYNDYCIKYKNTYTIDIDVLKELLVDYKDFYYLFLKSFTASIFSEFVRLWNA